MLISKSTIGSVLTSLLVCAAALTAAASPITPGQSVTAVGELDPVGGVQLFQTNKFFSSASFSGILTSTVYSGDLSNSFGGLTFTYQFSIDASNILNPSPDAASSITVGSLSGGFGGYLTDVSFQIPISTNIAPDSISRSPTAGGRNVTFDFTGNGYVLPGETSGLLVIQTSATDWALGNASLQDDVATPNILTLIPISISTIPEPTSFGLFSAGFLILGITYFKRQNHVKSSRQLSFPHPTREL